MSLSDLSASRISCEDDSRVILEFVENEDLDSALQQLVHDVTLLSGLCDGETVYGKLISTQTKDSSLVLDIERVELQDLFHHIKISGRSRPSSRRNLRQVNWVDGEMNDVSDTTQNRYSVNSQPFQVQKNFKKPHHKTCRTRTWTCRTLSLRMSDSTLIPSTQSAVQKEITDSTGSLVCKTVTRMWIPYPCSLKWHSETSDPSPSTQVSKDPYNPTCSSRFKILPSLPTQW